MSLASVATRALHERFHCPGVLMKGHKILFEVNSQIVRRTLNLSEEKPVFATGAVKPFVKARRRAKCLGPNSKNCRRDHGGSVGKPQRRHDMLLEKT